MPEGPPSRSCPSSTSARILSRNTSPTASSRTSSRPCRASSPSSSSPGTRPSPTRAVPSASSRSAGNSASAMCWRAASGAPAPRSASRRSSSMRAPGVHLWAEHYDGVVEDVFDLQDRITASVVGSIQPSIRTAEIERARRKRPENLDAYDLVMRALPYVWALEYEANKEAARGSWTRRFSSIPAIRSPSPWPLGAAVSGSSTTGRRTFRRTSARPCGRPRWQRA